MRGWIIGGVVVAIAAAAGGYWAFLVKEGQTGDPILDGMLSRLALELAKRRLLSPQHMRAMVAILHNEHSSGTPTAHVRDVMEPGDVTIRKGPSVGPGQVLRDTAIDLGLWPDQGDRDAQLADDDDRAAYLAFGTNPANQGELIGWAVEVYKSKLAAAGGDIPAAVQLYNGSGPDAVTYASNANDFLQLHFGGGLG